MNQDFYLALPIFFPIAAGCLTFTAGKWMPVRKNRMILYAAFLLIELALTYGAFFGDRSLVLWELSDQLVISFHVDDVSRLFAGLSTFAWLMAGIFALEYLEHDAHMDRFYGFYLIVEGALVALAFADNLVAYYIFFELMTLTSLPLVLHEMTHKAIMAGLKYLFYSIAGAFMALFGVFFLAQFGGIGSFAAGGILDMAAVSSNQGLLYAAAFLMILGFGTKAGMFPMHGWLPTAHPEAPAPASAVLSGVITKMGVLAILRIVYFVFGPNLLRGTWVQTAWLTLSLITVFMGSMLAYREKVMKKRFAYSTVSQVSYILFGLACMNQTAFLGALLHVVFHSMVKTTLFMSSGAIIHQTGKTMIADLKAIGKEMPVVIWCVTLVSITLVGIPPTSGFVSKWYLATGALSANLGLFGWLGPVILLVSALLTAGYLLPITIHGFFPGDDFDYSRLEKKEPGLRMLIPLLIMTALAVGFGMFPGALTGLIESIAVNVF